MENCKIADDCQRRLQLLHPIGLRPDGIGWPGIASIKKSPGSSTHQVSDRIDRVTDPLPANNKAAESYFSAIRQLAECEDAPPDNLQYEKSGQGWLWN